MKSGVSHSTLAFSPHASEKTHRRSAGTTMKLSVHD
jgi:hypothetical protein